MKFYTGELYHVYNRGNIHQKIFYQEKNYHFFLKKMNHHLTPYCHILAWCLMPNHFHWLIKVKDFTEIEEFIKRDNIYSDRHSALKQTSNNSSVHLIKPDISHEAEVPQLNKSIGVLLRSYTRAINRAYNSKGSLFQQGTKSKNLNSSWKSGDNYALICFLYILQNPVRAKLSNDFSGWPYSAYPDFAGLRNGTLCNQDLAIELFDLPGSGQKFAKFLNQSLPEHYQDHIF